MAVKREAAGLRAQDQARVAALQTRPDRVGGVTMDLPSDCTWALDMLAMGL